MPLTAQERTPAAAAVVVPALDSAGSGGTAPAADDLAPVVAGDLTLEQFVWMKRPLVVFADSPQDPAFQTQMQYLGSDPAALAERDVVIITDTDPAARSPIRNALRPRGFSLVWVDKDGSVPLRKPLPWTVREIAQAIDRTPLRREELLTRRPAGR